MSDCQFDFKEPASVEEANGRILELQDTAKAIELQLSTHKVAVNAGEKDPDPDWQKRANWALHFRNSEIRRLRTWIQEQRRNSTRDLLIAAKIIFDDLEKDDVAFTDSEKEIIEKIRRYTNTK